MRIEARDEHRKRIGRVVVDSSRRPTRAPVQGTQRELFLNWDTALDDAGRLRRCVACGCGDLFREKSFPQITGVVVVLAFGFAILGALGFATRLPVLIAMAVVLVLDVGILLFSRRRLVCYQCRSSYSDLEIAKYHGTWDRSVAERHPPPAPPPPPDAEDAAGPPENRPAEASS